MLNEFTNIAFDIIRPTLPFLVLTYLGYGLAGKSLKNDSDSMDKANRERLLTERSEEEKKIIREWEEKRRNREQKRVLDQIYK